KGASYSQVEASNIVSLLHAFSSAALARPETYDVLITQLTTPKLPLPIRELAAWHLRLLVPEAQKDLQAAPTAPPEVLAEIQRRLRILLPAGKVPPRFLKDKGAAEK